MSHHHGETTYCHCLGCEDDQMARNNYFTGKLLVERDFTDEQRFFLGKLQRHNHYLHGSGVVCGLEVVQHWNPDCRSTYVIIRPGYAIDCCGHEIIVPDELGGRNGEHGVLFNFAEAPAVKKLREENPPRPHTLEFCIRYKECGTEDIPVLYDECGCDDTRCAPNRILESYAIEVHVLDDQAGPVGVVPPTTRGPIPARPEDPGNPIPVERPAGTPPIFLREAVGPRALGGAPAGPDPADAPVIPPGYTRTYCERLLWYGIYQCRSCETPDCVTLAIVRGYETGFALWDPPIPPDTSANDVQNRISRIDNWSRRPILPSTRVLTDVIRCILRRCCPGDGTQPTDPGTTPQPTALTHISKISWKHNGATALDELLMPQGLPSQALQIAFDDVVRNGDLHSHSVVLQRANVEDDHRLCWCDVFPTEVKGGTFQTLSDITTPFTPVPTPPGGTPDPDAPVNGALLVAKVDPGLYRVLIKGDFIRDRNSLALDANHLPPWLPDHVSGDGVAGGLFESWFTLIARPAVPLNNANRRELIEAGATPALADRIIRERGVREFKSMADFRTRLRISAAMAKKLRVTIQ